MVTKQYPVEAQCQVQSQGDKNEASVHFLAANRNEEWAKTSFNSEEFTRTTKTNASKWIVLITRQFARCVSLNNSLLFSGISFPTEKNRRVELGNSGSIQVSNATMLDFMLSLQT